MSEAKLAEGVVVEAGDVMAFEAVMAGTPIYINGRVNRSIALLVRYVPQAVVKAIGRRLGRSYRKT